MKYALTAASLLALAAAEIHQVTVGPGLSYSPDSLTAADGDIVSFTFGAGHDVVSGTFDSPCQNNGMIYSGEPNEGDIFSVTINGTDPLWIYCSVPHHCQGGMAMVINPPSDHTVDDYKSAASNAGSSNAPSSVTGGIFGAVGSSSGSSSSSSSAAPAAASSASSSAASAASSASSSASAAASSASSSATAAASSASSSAASSASSASAAASASATGSAGNVVAPLSLVAGAVAGGVALLL